MKILLVAHRVPYPPDSGAKIRSYNMIRHLVGAGHDVTVAAPARNETEFEQVQGLRDLCPELVIENISEVGAKARMLAQLATTTPSSMGYFYSGRLQQRIDALVRERAFDFIIVHSSSVAPYVTRFTNIPKMLDFCDMDSQKWLSYFDWKPFPLNVGYWLEGTKLAAAEKRLAASFDVSTVATPAELHSLEELGTAPAADWFANGVDSDFFTRTRPYDSQGPVVFVGRMDYYPNEKAMVDFCRDNWPALREAKSGLQLAIVGASPTRKVKALANLPGVTVTGYVDDVRPWLERASVAIAPLEIARGTQNKILEAMAMELPVVSSETAAGGVNAEPGHHLEVAGDAEQLNAAILELRAHPGRSQALGTAARAQVLAAHTWDASMTRMQRIVEKFANQR